MVALGIGFGGVMIQNGGSTSLLRTGMPVIVPEITVASTPRTAPARPEPAPTHPLPPSMEEDAPAARVETALGVLSRFVEEQSHPEALRAAFQAYYNFKAEHPEQVRKPYLYYVDYGLDNRTPRGYVFDMESLTVVEGPFTVAHGRGSSSTRDGRPTRFSNRQGSNATSLGLYLTQETYSFRGTSGGQRYTSVGLRLRGLSGMFNSAARERGVVAHGAPYVTPRQAGRSEGCPAMEQSRAKRLLPKISDGGLVFLFSPLDSTWMHKDPWAARGDQSAGPARG